MNTHWQSFLATQGATVDAASNAHFPDMPHDAECALCALGDTGIIAIHGEDATDFLQRQLSNDLRELFTEHCQLSSHCNAKGRMLANFRVLRESDGYWLVLPREQIASLLPRLRMFVLRAKVSLADLSDEFACFGLLGECHRALLSEHFESLPEADNDLHHQANSRLIRIAGPRPRWLFLGPPALAESLWQQAAERGACLAGSDLWALQDIRAGIPIIRAATSELFVPQMTNMQLIDGLSFHKGCYTGQEVVARMQYLGKLKRRMYVASVTLSDPPAAGTRLESPGSQSEQSAGVVVDARRNDSGGCELLAVAEISAVARGDLALAETGTPLSLQPPPYGFPPEV